MTKRRGSAKWILAGIVLTVVFSLHAAAEDPQSIVIPLLPAAPALSGNFDDPSWNNAALISRFTQPQSDKDPTKAIAVRIGTDGQALFISVKCGEPEPDKIKADAKNRNDNVWTDDCVEVWLRPTSDAMDSDQFLVNALGTQGEQRTRAGIHQDWKPGWTVKTSKDASSWTAQLRIPAADLGWSGFHRGDMLGLKIGREDHVSNPAGLAVWPAGATYAGLENFGRSFVADANCVQNPGLENKAGWSIDQAVEKNFEHADDGLRIHSPNAYCAADQTLKLQPNTLYKVSAEVKAPGTMYIRVRAPQTDKHADERTDLAIEKSDDFKAYAKTFVTGAEGKGLLVVGVTETSGIGDFSVRNLRVERALPDAASGPAIAVKAGGEPLLVSKLRVTDCRALKGFIGAPVDGTLKSGQWDSAYWEYNQPGAGAGVYYTYHGNDGLHITFADNAGFNFCVVRGGIKAKLYRDCQQFDDPKSGAQIWDFPGNTVNSRAWFPEIVKTNKASFFDVRDGVIGDCSFFRVSSGLGGLQSKPLTFDIGGEVAKPADSIKQRLEQRFDATERVAFAATSQDSEHLKRTAEKFPLAGGKAVHFITEPLKDETPLAAIDFSATVDATATKIPFTIRLQDPLNPRLELHGADYELDKAGALRVVCEFPHQIVPKGAQLWVTVRFGKPVALRTPQLVLHTISREEAAPEALAHRRFLLKNFYAVMSEARPWNGFNSQEAIDTFLKGNSSARPWVAEILETLDQCRAIDTEGKDPVVRQYYEWIYHTVLRKAGKLAPWPAKFDAIDGVPEWASLVHQAWMQARDVPQWWIDNRMTPDGETGGEINDDTKLPQNFAGFMMLERDGIGGRERAHSLLLAETAQHQTLEEGLNKTTMDALHAYEEGLNHESLMLYVNYGDPVYYERCMIAARSLEKITFLTPDGRRHFKTIDEVGSADLRRERKPVEDGEFNHLMMHPALEAAWYNHHPRIIKMLREWADGWLDRYSTIKAGAPGEPGKYPEIVEPESSTVKKWGEQPFPGCWGGEGSAFMFMAELTREAKYIQPYLDFLVANKDHQIESHLPELLQLGFIKPGDEKYAHAIERNWAATLYAKGDTAQFVTAIKKDIEELQRFPYMYTAVECFCDRVFLYALTNPSIAYTGGFYTRNKINQTYAVSWDGMGTDFAALVTRAEPTGLRVLICNLTDKPISGSASLWRIDHGQFDVTFGPEGQAPQNSKSAELQRGSIIPVELPKKGVFVLEIRQSKALDPVYERADLALSKSETKVEGGKVRGVVHNIGVKDVDDVVVALRNNKGEIVARKSLGKLAAPLDLAPKTIPFEFDALPADVSGWSLVADPENKVPDNYMGNNHVDL